QQQLLLVILVTIIVGIATVVAINVFGTSAESANRDAVRQDVLTIAAASQGWYIKPEMMGGGGNSFDGMTFRDINFSAEKISETDDGVTAENMNGTYVMDTSAGTSVTLTAHPSSDISYVPSEDAADASVFTGATETMEATIVKDGVSWGS
ncbi:MAG: hypothetical protein WD512_02675, partial [Candidatus Paceibacterota bacterium]